MLCGYLQFKSFFVVYKEAQVGGAGGGVGGGGHGLKGPGSSLLLSWAGFLWSKSNNNGQIG
jgi:hypothetical protein